MNNPTQASAVSADTTPPTQGVSPEVVQAYALRRPFFVDYASIIETVIRQSLERADVRFLDVQSRAKSVEGFREKAGRLAGDGISLKYTDPLVQLTDLAACRVIVFFPKTIQQVEDLLRTELDVIEKVDHAASAVEEGRL